MQPESYLMRERIKMFKKISKRSNEFYLQIEFLSSLKLRREKIIYYKKKIDRILMAVVSNFIALLYFLPICIV
jgi:hypothetical protein